MERMLYHFLKNLPQAGGHHEYVLFVDQPLNVVESLGVPFRVVVEPIKFKLIQKIFDYWMIIQLRKHIKKHEIDVFFAPTIKFPFASIPRYTTLHDMAWYFFPSGYTFRERIKSWLWFHLCTHYSAGIVTFANNTLHDLRKLRPKCPVPIRVIPEGVDPMFRQLPPNQRSIEILDQLGVCKPYILAVSSLMPRKNFSALIRVYAQLVKHHSIPHQLALVGQPQWRSERLYSQVSSFGLESRVCCTGYISDEQLVQLYNQATLFVYPSIYEGFGLPVLEAMACGVPVVTSNTTSLKEVAGEAAILIDPHDETDLSNGMLRGLNDQDLRASLIHSGFARTREFSWEMMTQQICQFITGAHA